MKKFEIPVSYFYEVNPQNKTIFKKRTTSSVRKVGFQKSALNKISKRETTAVKKLQGNFEQVTSQVERRIIAERTGTQNNLKKYEEKRFRNLSTDFTYEMPHSRRVARDVWKFMV